MLVFNEKICKKYGSNFTPPDNGSKMGVALSTIGTGSTRINGLRHRLDEGTNGWFLWAGDDELSNNDDFFDALHIEHLVNYAPSAIPYLGLESGWRFLIDKDYIDVWYDQSILDNAT